MNFVDILKTRTDFAMVQNNHRVQTVNNLTQLQVEAVARKNTTFKLNLSTELLILLKDNF